MPDNELYEDIDSTPTGGAAVTETSPGGRVSPSCGPARVCKSPTDACALLTEVRDSTRSDPRIADVQVPRGARRETHPDTRAHAILANSIATQCAAMDVPVPIESIPSFVLPFTLTASTATPTRASTSSTCETLTISRPSFTLAGISARRMTHS